MQNRYHIPTIFFIGCIAWAISNAGHEILGHGLTAMLLGYKALGVSTSFFIYDESVVSFWDSKLITVGGTFFNICLSFFSYYILKKHVLKSIHSIYFFWILMSFNMFYSGSYIMGWFFGPTLDSSLIMVGFESPVLLKTTLTLFGLFIVLIGYRISGMNLNVLFDSNEEGLGKKITLLTLYPYLAAIFIKVSAGLMNQSDDKMLVVLGSFGATGFFLIWINFIRFWPYKNLSNVPVPNITINVKWIISGIFIVLIYVFVLGRGIGQIQ